MPQSAWRACDLHKKRRATTDWLTGAALERVLDAAQRLMAMNIVEPQRMMSRAIGRRTTDTLDASQKL
jgi:hypothetical protein